MWTHSIKLKTASTVTYDDDGFPVAAADAWMTNVPASITDITRKDQEMADQLGFEAEKNIEIMACNYAGQRMLVDEETNEIWYVQRTFRADRADTIILTCGRRERGGQI